MQDRETINVNVEIDFRGDECACCRFLHYEDISDRTLAPVCLLFNAAVSINGNNVRCYQCKQATKNREKIKKILGNTRTLQ